MIDIYNRFIILYKNNEIVGYCFTSIEADDICKKLSRILLGIQ